VVQVAVVEAQIMIPQVEQEQLILVEGAVVVELLNQPLMVQGEQVDLALLLSVILLQDLLLILLTRQVNGFALLVSLIFLILLSQVVVVVETVVVAVEQVVLEQEQV
jgi:hypothetical protein